MTDILATFPYRVKAKKNADGSHRAWIPCLPGVEALGPNRKRALRDCMRAAEAVLATLPGPPPYDRRPPDTRPVLELITAKDAARFWSRVDKNGPIPAHAPHLGPCWVWTGKPSDVGYGRINVRRKILLAHRVAFALSGGQLENGQLVCHKCNNRMCCNPAHHYAGTKADNAADMMAAGTHNSVAKPETMARGDRHGSRTAPHRVARGERNGLTKLTAPLVTSLRRDYADGMMTIRDIAIKYSVSSSCVFAVATGVVWGHVPGAVQPRGARRSAA